MTSQIDDRHRLYVRVLGIGEERPASLLHETFAPMRRVIRPSTSKNKKEHAFVGFAFTRDGEWLAQISTNPNDVRPSPIRKFPLVSAASPRVKRSEWLPDETSGKRLAAATRSSPGLPQGLVSFYNEQTAEESSQLVFESDLATSPDGARVARFEKDLKIHIIERATSREILSIPSGLDSNALRRGQPQISRMHLSATNKTRILQI